MVVVDASAVVELLLNRAIGARARQRLFDSGETVHAPHLIDIEVLHVLRRYNWMREMTDASAEEAVTIYSGLPIEHHSHEVILRRVWELRSNLTAYAAAYVALAELLGVRLVTTDARLARSARHVAELIQ